MDVAPVPVPIGGEALIPNPALEVFQPLIGQWQTTGVHPLVPGTTFHGRALFAWHEGGAFLVMRTEIDEPEIPSGIAIFGSDGSKTFFMLYFDERGVSRKYDVVVAGNSLTWWREEPSLSQRFTITVGGDGNTMTGKGEMSRDGGPWEGDLSLTYSRIGA